MNITRRATPRLKFHRDAYRFVFEALQYTQEQLNRVSQGAGDEDAHITGGELCLGIRDLAIQKFGLLSRQVFAHWGVHHTDDFGHIVFELIERGEMRKTDRDQLSDFFNVYDFNEAFDTEYRVDTDTAFRRG